MNFIIKWWYGSWEQEIGYKEGDEINQYELLVLIRDHENLNFMVHHAIGFDKICWVDNKLFRQR